MKSVEVIYLGGIVFACFAQAELKAQTAPVMTIGQTQTNTIVISWPDGPWQLLSAATLDYSPIQWTNVSVPVTSLNGQSSVVLAPSAQAAYYQLASTSTWSPSALGPKLVAWYEGSNSYSDLAGQIRATNGGVVRLCKDLSGYGYNLTNNASDGSLPIYRNDTSVGQGALFFECNWNTPVIGYPPRWLSTRLDTPVWSQPNTVYAVCAKTEQSIYDNMFGYVFSGTASAYDEALSAGFDTLTSLTPDFQAASPYTHWWFETYSTNYHLVTVNFVPSGSWINVDGTNQTVALDMGTGPLRGIVMGSKYEHTHSFGGWIAGLWVINGTNSPAENQSMTNWIRSKYRGIP